jgi:hypothetical protein
MKARNVRSPFEGKMDISEYPSRFRHPALRGCERGGMNPDWITLLDSSFRAISGRSDRLHEIVSLLIRPSDCDHEGSEHSEALNLISATALRICRPDTLIESRI